MNHVHHLQYCRITGVEKDFNTINEYLNNYSFLSFHSLQQMTVLTVRISDMVLYKLDMHNKQ